MIGVLLKVNNIFDAKIYAFMLMNYLHAKEDLCNYINYHAHKQNFPINYEYRNNASDL